MLGGPTRGENSRDGDRILKGLLFARWCGIVASVILPLLDVASDSSRIVRHTSTGLWDQGHTYCPTQRVEHSTDRYIVKGCREKALARLTRRPVYITRVAMLRHGTKSPSQRLHILAPGAMFVPMLSIAAFVAQHVSAAVILTLTDIELTV